MDEALVKQRQARPRPLNKQDKHTPPRARAQPAVT